MGGNWPGVVLLLVGYSLGCGGVSQQGVAESPSEPPVVTDDPSPAAATGVAGPCLAEPAAQATAVGVGGVCALEGFCFEHPLPHGDDLVRVFAQTDGSILTVLDHFLLGAGMAPAYRITAHDWAPVWVPFDTLAVTAPFEAWGPGPTVDCPGYCTGSLLSWNGTETTNELFPDLGPVEISGPDSSHLWLLGRSPLYSNSVWFRDPGGLRYAGPLITDRVESLTGTSWDNAWVVGAGSSNYGGRALRFNGSAWTQGSPEDLAVGLVRTHGIDDTWVFGWSRAAHHDGASWTIYDTGLGPPDDGRLLSNRLREAWWRSPLSVWAVGDHGAVIHFDGSHFEVMDAGATANLTGIAGQDESELWAVGDAGTLIRWNGHAWTLIASGYGQDLVSIWGATEEDLWAVGQAVLHRVGTQWRIAAVPASHLREVDGSGPKDVWAVGDAGEALHYDGECWRNIEIPLSFGARINLVSIWVAGPGSAYAVGTVTAADGYERGIVLKWDGTAWTRVHERSKCPVAFVRGSSTDDVWVTGCGGGALHLTSAGWSFVPLRGTGISIRSPTDVITSGGYRWLNGTIAPLVEPRYLHLVARGRSDVWLGRRDDGWFIAHFDGETFTESPVSTPSNGLGSMWVSEQGTAFAVGGGGSILAMPLR